MGFSANELPKQRRPSALLSKVGRSCVAPTALHRRDALIAAAERVFCTHGYHDSTMDDVASAAGISKRTLYQLVQSKEELFSELLDRHSNPFDTVVTTANRPIAEVLRHMLAGWAHHVLSPPILSLLRVIMADYIHGHTLSRLLDREFARKCREPMVSYLAACDAEHRLVIPDPDSAAQMLFGMAIGSIQIELLLGVGEAPDHAAIDARITAAVSLFLAGGLARHPAT